MHATKGMDGKALEAKYQKIKEIRFSIAEEPNEKNWVIVIFENGTHWMPALLDLGDILSKIGKCEDIKYPNGQGYKYTLKFITSCFGKTRKQIYEAYKKCYDPNDLLKGK